MFSAVPPIEVDESSRECISSPARPLVLVFLSAERLCAMCATVGNNNDLLTRILILFRDTVFVRVIEFLYIEGKPCSLRKISRNVGVNHKNLAKYLDSLVKAGIVEIVYEEKNLRLYTLSSEIDWGEVRLFLAAASVRAEDSSARQF